MDYRTLTKAEIKALLNQGCYADDWADISVGEGFSTECIRNTRFSGKIKMAFSSGMIEVEKGISRPCGILNSTIRDCDISGHVYISEAKNVTNYIIEDDVCIENVGSLTVNNLSTFGNGVEIEVLNEGGGRELPIFDKLSSQIAYLVVLYRHDKDFTGKLLDMIRQYAASKKSNRGRIESGARILNSLIIRNVNIGSHSIISGIFLLEEGTIISCKTDPAMIGEGVVAKRFIVLSGSQIDSCAIIDKSFVGQGVRMGRQYSAENSVFFANCEAFHGEACSLFAGPYTVTHHKSTLMIASLFSFFNGGSGTNESNHMYKLGPVHQGILERGAKTGSFAYLFLPCVVGAFNVVMGKHYANFDTADFPFSYIKEEKGKSIITPGMNLFTVGTRRDSEKWPTRDRRKDPQKLDLIHFDLFSPYIVGKILNAINILNELNDKAQKTQDLVNYKGIHIPRLLLKTTRRYYEMALNIYLGREIVNRLEGVDEKTSLDEIRKKLMPHGDEGKGKWVEICGMFSPLSKIEELMNSVKSGKIRSVNELNSKLGEIYKNYNQYSWTWCADLLGQKMGGTINTITVNQLVQIINDWKVNSVKMNNMILKDAEKEFDENSKIGFGIDGDMNTRDMDFQVVRGRYEENKFVLSLLKESEEIEHKADHLVAILEKKI